MKISYPEDNKGDDLRFGNQFGKYLISHFNTWHGGIHIEGTNKKILAIADGRIIAYRMCDEYKTIKKTEDSTNPNDVETSIEKELLYSNSFILMQHDLLLQKEEKENEGESNEVTRIKKKYVTFYSLYHHLMPIKEVEDIDALDAPTIFGKKETVVVKEEGYQYKVQGLNAWTEKNGNKDKVKLIIPFGKRVTILKDENGNKIKLKNNKWYTNVSYNGNADIYIFVHKNFVKEINESEYEIITYTEDTKKWEGEQSVLGARVRHAKNSKAVIKDIIPNGEKVIIEKKEKGWYIIKGYDGFSYERNFKTKVLFDDTKIERNKIEACDIPVKAGEHIGYTGLIQSELSDYYNACHLDVFMAEGVEDFLENKFGMGKEEQHYTLFAQGTKLKKSIEIAVELPRGMPVKVVDIKGIYVKIKQDKQPVTATIKKSLLEAKNYRDPAGSNNAYYIVGKSNFNEINKAFNGRITNSNESLYWVSRAKADGTKISKSEENELIKKASEKNNIYVAYRKLTYKPKNNPQEYWVKQTDLFPVPKIKIKEVVVKEKVPLGRKSKSILEYFQKEDCRYEEKTIQIKFLENLQASKGDHTLLNKQICTAYIAIPENETDIDEELCKTGLVDLRKTKEVKQGKDKKWIHITANYVAGNTEETKKGWLENKKFDTFSAYNWAKFGFTLLDGGNEYMYDVKELREESSTESNFVKKVWKTLSITNDEVLDIFEINAAYRTLETQLAIAKMVCKHKIEWAYSPQEIADEVTKFYDYLISKQEPEAQSELETLKNEKLDALKDTVKNLMFWKEASDLPYTTPLTVENVEDLQQKTKENSNELLSSQKGVNPIENQNGQTLIPATEDELETTMANTVNISLARVSETSVGTAPLNPNIDSLGIEQVNGTAPFETPTKANSQFDPTILVAENGSEELVKEPDQGPTIIEDEIEKPLRIFPRIESVYHFHPIAFLEQMNRILRKTGNCLCKRDLTVEEVKLMIKRLTGKESLWSGISEPCDIKDKSFVAFTNELNKMFEKYRFETCIEKISFLAQAAHETGGFQQTKEEKSKFKSSTSTYKGRGLIQITGNPDTTGYYNQAGLYKKYADNVGKPEIETNPDLISSNIHYTIDASGWYFSSQKKVPTWNKKWSTHDNIRKKKVAYFNEGLGKSLLQLSSLINKDVKYFWLQSKILNGYPKKQFIKVPPNGWVDRKKKFNKLNAIFRFNTECINNQNIYELKSRASWMDIAYGELWTEELIGSNHNPRVLEYHASSGHNGNNITDDDDWPWCSSFACWVFTKSKEYTGKITAKATNWANWGKEESKDNPMYGALAVIDWGKNDNGKGHVGFVVNVDGDKIYLLGGNQTGGDKSTGGKVCIGRYDKSDIDYYRIPENYEPIENDYIYDEIKGPIQGLESFSTTT